MSKIYLKILAFIAPKFLEKLAPGLKTFLVAAITFILGAAETLSNGGFYNLCCENIHVLCNVSQSQFYAGFITFLGFVLQVLNGNRALNALELSDSLKEGVTPTHI